VDCVSFLFFLIFSSFLCFFLFCVALLFSFLFFFLISGDVIQFLARNIQQIPFRESTLRQLGLGNRRVVSVSATQTTLDALRVMVENSVSSVVLLDSEEALNGNAISVLSLTDVKYLFNERTFGLLSNCFDFVKRIREQQSFDKGGNIGAPIFAASLDSSFSLAVARLAATRAH
jgi:CBS-domain-containing membrane protein